VSHPGLLQRLAARLPLWRRFLPALAFFSGFIWDSLTMGRLVSFSDLLILTAYYLGAALVLILLVREIKPAWHMWFGLLIQFLFGGLFSALVVFYFKSAGSLYTFVVVLLLATLLVANEFLAEKYQSRTLSWTIFAACGTMYLNFLIPHIAHSVRPAWFYLSCLISLALVYAIRRFARAMHRQVCLPGGTKVVYRSDLRQLAPATAVTLLLMVFYQLQLIPPVPLVLKENLLCREVNKTDDVYQCRAEQQPFWHLSGLRPEVIHHQDGDRIYNLSAVFAPQHVTVDLEQRWWQRDAEDKTWRNRGIVPLAMVGGRRQGWRTYSYIQATARPGRWKVETALQNGAILGVHHFIIKPRANSTPTTYTITVR